MITGDHVHLRNRDMRVGAVVAVRDVTVRVTFPDGKPMKTARVVVRGAAPRPGDLPWTDGGVTLKGVPVHVRAPANRTLQIEVEDWYGRDLKAVYRSTHAPGTRAIEQAFVVRP